MDVLKKTKNRQIQKAKQTLNPQDIIEVIRINNKIKKEITEMRNNCWASVMEITGDKNRYPNLTNGSSTKNIRNKTTHLPPIQGPKGIIFTDKQKLGSFAETPDKQIRHHH